MLNTALQIHIPYMREKSTFSSKKISKHRNTKNLTTSKKSPNKNGNRKADEIFSNQEIKQDLQSFYDNEAKKYAETRKKFWHEEKAILDAITPLFGNVISNECEKSTGQMECDTHMDPHASFHSAQDENTHMDSSAKASEWQFRKLRVLEFGCWSGRFATLLNQQFPGQFDYVWIDLSDELLSYAGQDNPNLTFFQWDITKLIKIFEQESFDLIIWTSSFQHIPTNKERSFLMKNFYRLLCYDGMLLMTNRSMSSWFIKKNRKAVLKARILSWIKFDSWSARDLLVPRTDNEWKVYQRFYHFFSLKELEKLTTFAGLTVKTNTFIDGDGNFADNEKTSRSSLLVATKSPIIN